jgi:hypothetical protein
METVHQKAERFRRVPVLRNFFALGIRIVIFLSLAAGNRSGSADLIADL